MRGDAAVKFLHEPEADAKQDEHDDCRQQRLLGPHIFFLCGIRLGFIGDAREVCAVGEARPVSATAHCAAVRSAVTIGCAPGISLREAAASETRSALSLPARRGGKGTLAGNDVASAGAAVSLPPNQRCNIDFSGAALVADCCGALAGAWSFLSPNSEPIPENMVKPDVGEGVAAVAAVLAGAAGATLATAWDDVEEGACCIGFATDAVADGEAFFGVPLGSR